MNICKICGLKASSYVVRREKNKDGHGKNAKKKMEILLPMKYCETCSEKLKKSYIIYECPCIHKRKIKHHFDYKRPYEVILLCPSCHRKEHVRLRNLNISLDGYSRNEMDIKRFLEL